MSNDKNFDLIVIGGGTGGNGVARTAANANATAAAPDAAAAAAVGSAAERKAKRAARAKRRAERARSEQLSGGGAPSSAAADGHSTGYTMRGLVTEEHGSLEIGCSLGALFALGLVLCCRLCACFRKKREGEVVVSEDDDEEP